MTSKKSSTKAKPLLYTILSGFKSPAAAAAAINFVVFSLVVVLSSFIALGRTTTVTGKDGTETIQKIAELYKYLLINMSDAYGILLLVSVVLTSLLAAIFSFKFITSKKTVNVFYSLGISRDNLFLGKYIPGAVLMVVSVVVPFLISFIGNIAFIGYSSELASATLFYIFSYSATALIVYAVTSACFAAVGTFFEAAAFSGVALAFPTILFFSLQTLMSRFVNGSPYGVGFYFANGSMNTLYNTASEKLYLRFSFLNPLVFDYSSITSWGAMMAEKRVNPSLAFGTGELAGSPSILRAICWILISVAVMFLGMFIFQKRKSEICGFIGTNKYLNTFATFTVGFFVLSVILDKLSAYLSTILVFVIGFAVFALIYAIIELLMLRDFKAFLRGLYKLPAEMIVSGIIVVIFATGLFGYSSKIPDASEIAKVAVTPVGISSEYGYFQENYSDALSGTQDFQYSGKTGIVDGFTSQNDIKTITELHQRVVNLGKLTPTKFDDKDVTDNDRILSTTLQFVYTLKDGSTVLRNYNAVTPDVYKAFLAVEDTDFFKSRLDTMFIDKINEESTKSDQYDATEKDMLEYAKNIFRNQHNEISIYAQDATTRLELTLTMAEKAELARCIYKDLQNRTVDQKYFPENDPLGFINFSYNAFFTNPDFGMNPGSDVNESEAETVTASESETVSETQSQTQNTTESTTGASTSASKAPASSSSALKISPLSAGSKTGNTTASGTTTTTAETQSTTNAAQAAAGVTSSTTDTTAPETTQAPVTDKNTEVIPDGLENLIGTEIENAIKYDGDAATHILHTERYNGLTIVLTSDMENTISFLKSKNLYDVIVAEPVYASAEIISVVNYNSSRPYFSYGVNDVCRYFTGSYTKFVNTSKDEGMYYNSVFDSLTGFSVTDKLNVNELLKAAKIGYFNNTDTGYYVRFETADKITRVTKFIPYNLLSDSLKSQIKEHEASDKFKSNGMYY